MKKSIPLLAGILANLIFGTTFYAITIAHKASGGDALLLLSYRFLIGSFVLFLPILFRKVIVNYKNKPILILFFISILNPVIGFFSETAALNLIPSSQLSIFISLTPIVAVTLSVILIKERPTKLQLIFMFISIIGVIIINTTGSLNPVPLLGVVLILSYMFSNSLYRISLIKLSKIFSTYELTFLVTFFAGIVFTVISMSMHTLNGDVSTYFTAALDIDFMIPTVYLSVASTVCAMFMANYATANLPITVSSALSTITPVMSVVLGVALLKEPFGINDLIGTIIILSGVLGITMAYGYKKVNIKK